MSAAYRFQQGIRALGARFRPVDDELARDYLTPALYMLYAKMRRSERQHSLRVLRDLLADGYNDPDLLTAGLLHDVGKSRAPFTIPEKVLVVLVKAIVPGLYRRWGSGPARGWRRPFAVSFQHPEWSAEMVKIAGGSALAIDLIRQHANLITPPPQSRTEELLLALQAADNRN